MSWSEIKKKKEEEEKKRASKKSNSDVSRIANALTGSLWKDVGQNIITSERNAEIKRKQEQEEKRKNSYTQNMPSTYKRTIQPSVTQTMSRDNNVSIVKQSDLKNQKLEKAQENSTWGNIVNFIKNTGRAIDNIKNGAIKGTIGAGQSITKNSGQIQNFAFNTSKTITEKLFGKSQFSGTPLDPMWTVNKQQEKINEDRQQTLESMGAIRNKYNKKIEGNIQKAQLTGDSVGKFLTEITPSIGQQVPGYILNAIAPGSSLFYFQASSEADYYDDAKARGMTDAQADLYAKGMSLVESGTEQFTLSNVKKVGKVTKGALSTTKNYGLKEGLKKGLSIAKEGIEEEAVHTMKDAFKQLGLTGLENAVQEGITEPIQELTAMAVAGKDKANWDDIWGRIWDSSFKGAVTGTIMGGAEMGYSSCQVVANKMRNGIKPTQQEISSAVKEYCKGENVDFAKILTDDISNKVQEIKQVKTEVQQQNEANKDIDQEIKTSQNGTSQVSDTTEALRQEARNKLESIKQKYDENSYNQMQEFIETAPSEKALNQVINDLNKEAETKQVAPLKQKQEVQLPMKQGTQNKSFEDVAFEAMNNYESNEVESPLKNRDMDSIGKQTKVNAYQYDNPQVKPYFQEMAQQMGEDLAYISSSDNRSTQKGGGTKLSATTKAMDILHNEQGYSYNQIAQGLQNIIDDKGSENNAISKKIELVIDEQLRNGYNNAFGKYVEPNQEYINTIQGNKDVQLPMKQKQEVSLPLNEDVLNNQNTSQEQNQTISKDTNKVMNEVQNYIKNNDLDMTADEFVEWASNVELENEENMTQEQKELYSLISDIQNRTNMEENDTRNNNIPNNVSIKDSQGRTDNSTENIKQSSRNEFIENSEKSSFLGKEYNSIDDVPQFEKSRSNLRPTPRKGWTIEKIQKQLKTEKSGRASVKELNKFENIDELMDNIFYHGSISAHDNLKAGSTLKEEQRTGGYGEEYHTISLSKSKNIASNFASTGNEGTVMPVLLKKGSNVISMPNIQDSIELEDILPELWNKNVDAVKIGDWDIDNKGYGEQEIVILNPASIATMGYDTTYFKNFGKPKFQNMTKEEISNSFNKYIDRAIEGFEYQIEKAKNTDINTSYIYKTEEDINKRILYLEKQIKEYKEMYNKFSLKNENTTTDNQGRQLSKQQQEYFKDSKVRDKNGNLLTLYHGTNSEFNVYDLSKGGQSNSGASIGFWFTETKKGAENFANDVWYGDKKPNVKENYLDLKNPKVYENVQNEELKEQYRKQSDELENKAKELRKEYSWDKTDYKTTMTFDTLIRDYQQANYQKKNVDLDLFERLAKERGFNEEQISNMERDAKKYVELLQESKNATNEYYKLRYGDAYEQFKIDLYETGGQTAEEANTGGLGMALNNPKETVEKFRNKLIEEGYDGIIIKNTQYDNSNFNGENNQYVAFYPNQIKNVDNKTPTTNPDIRYELEDHSDNTAENEIQRKINRSMTMEQAKDMVQRAFVTGKIYDWFDGQYKTGDEWLAGEGASDVALIIDNDFNLQNKYVNANEDILNEEYTIDDVIEAYQNGTLTGSSENQTQRLDTSKDTGYKDDRFYAPKDITGGKELYDLASQRVTNKNRNDIYKARADFIINAHNEGYIESLGLDSKEVYEKLRSWTSYPKNALQTSMEINKGVSKENRWTGIENCSVVNELSVSQEQLDSLVKEIKGTSDDYQRRYISNTMLALDTHLNYKNLTFDFAPNATNMGDSVLGDYQPDYDVIRVKRDGQNTVSHEMGHYIDHLIGRELANGYNLGITRLCRSNLDSMMNGTTFTQEQKQFLRNFANFLEDIENSSDIGSSYKMSSDEVFARFVARFTEWTRNVATGNRYGYEAKWYDDHFNQSQYKEFAKLLQEYSLLKTTEQASGRSTTLASQRTGQIQEQKIEDIFNELNKKKKTQENTEQSQKVQLPMKEKQEVKAPLKGNVQQNQNNNTPGENINWTEIERPENNQKFRKHYRSIIESSNTTAEAKAVAKELMGTDTYTPETNKGQLAQADQRIMTSSPEVELQSLLSRAMNGEKISSVDIAVGERLIQYFSKTGNKQQLQDAIQATAMAGTSAGQTVQALSMLNHQTPQGQATWIQRSVDKMNKELAKKKGGTITTDADGNLQVINKQGVDITDKVDLFNLTPEMIDKIMNSENQEQMYKNIDEVYEELGQQVPKGMLEKIDSWRYFSMLANARTHIRNMVGNLAMGKTQRIKDKLAGGIEDVVSKFNPKMERTKTLAFADKKTKDFAKQDFKNMEVQSRLELNENKYNPQSRLQNARRTFKSNAMENTLGRLFNLNDKLLSAEDGIGLKAGYQKALADYITANKIDVDNITDAQLNKARNYAVQQAKEATFHQANAIASAVAQFENKNLATKLFTGAILPFKKTPMNVAKAGMEYSPLQIAKSATVDLVNLRKGNISVNQYIDNLSKGMTGTGIALVGYALANAGILKASGGDDKDKEKYEEEQGKQSYSIQIAGKTYSLDWLTPTGIPLFIGAETYKLFNQEETEKSTEKKSEEDRLNQAIKGASNLLNAGATAINPMSEMSMISGLTSALSSYNTSDNLGSLGNIMTNAGKSYVNQFFPTLMGQVAKTTDKYERTTKSTATGTIGKAVDQTINQIKNKIPGLRQTLPIKTDIWGNDVKQEVNLPLRAVNNFINPATVKEVSTDKVDKELNKLYEESKNSALLPDILQKKLTLNKTDYRLTNKEYAEFTKNYGQTSHKLIENFIKTSDYNKLTQEQKETAISNIYSYAKEQNKMDYAKKVNETVKPSTLYTTMKEIEKNGGKQSEYLNYLSKTKGMSKESEKNKVLANSNYSNKTKEIIYTNGTGKDDILYNNLLSKSNINMTEYLNYKSKITQNTNKEETLNYLNKYITKQEDRLLIASKKYSLQNNEKQKLAQYINSIVNTREERIEIYKQLDKNFYVRNGKVYMRVSK